MRNSLLLMPIIIAISAISPQAYSENSKPKQASCEQQLRTIALAKFNITGINSANLQAELGDNEGNNQSIRIFMIDKTGVNGGATFG